MKIKGNKTNKIQQHHHTLETLYIVITVLAIIYAINHVVIDNHKIEKTQKFCKEQGWYYNNEYTNTPFACWKSYAINDKYTIIQRNVGVHYDDGWLMYWIDIYPTNITGGEI